MKLNPITGALGAIASGGAAVYGYIVARPECVPEKLQPTAAVLVGVVGAAGAIVAAASPNKKGRP